MTTSQSRRDVNVREALASIRSTMSNAEVMEKFKITPAGFADLLKQLFTHKLISQEDLVRRGIQFKVVSQTVARQPAQPIPIVPRNSRQEDDEFLDTLELTELLSFKPLEAPKPVKKPVTAELGQQTDQDRPVRGKKGKLGISSLFKKTW